jgi:Family of unknown function (DUF5906)/Domain of unknown function (DUF3854)
LQTQFTNGATAYPDEIAQISYKLSPETLADLARSGLTEDDASRMGIYEIGQTALRRLFGRYTAARALVAPVYAIPYFTPDGRDTDHRRFRILGGDGPKYLQTPGSGSLLYFSKSTQWTEYIQDTSKKLYFGEGEKSSYRAGKAGLAMIGMGGCWNFSGRKKGRSLIRDFDLLKLNGRDVEIVADSDASTNYSVLAALHSFAAELSSKGARPSCVILEPKPDLSKQSIDDYLESKSLAIVDFHRIERRSFELLTNLYAIRQRYAVITGEPAGALVDTDMGQVITREAFLTVVANLTASVPNSKGELKLVAAGPEYIKWAQRREYTGLAYSPGQPRDTAEGHYNLWTGWPVEPRRGDVTPWNELLDHIFGDDQAARNYFQQWAAFPFAHPGIKLIVAALIWGCQEAGKSLLGEVLCQVYGKANSSELQTGELSSHFNPWSKHKQFVLSNEMLSGDKRIESSRIKNIISRERLTINTKFQPEYTIRDTINYFLSSNLCDAAYLEGDDRRFFVWHVSKKLDSEKGTRIKAWAESDEGRAALLWYFMHEVDLTGFSPRARAPMTAAKLEMIDDNRSDLDSFAFNLVDACRSDDKPQRHQDLRTIDSMAFQFEDQKGRRPAEKSLGHSLKRASATKLKRVRVGAQFFSVWALANGEYWSKAESNEIVKALRGNGQVEIAKIPKF